MIGAPHFGNLTNIGNSVNAYVRSEVQKMARSGAGIREILTYLESDDSFILTPLNFIRLLSDAFGIPWRETGGVILTRVDPCFRTITSEDDLEEAWNALISDRVDRP